VTGNAIFCISASAVVAPVIGVDAV